MCVLCTYVFGSCGLYVNVCKYVYFMCACVLGSWSFVCVCMHIYVFGSCGSCMCASVSLGHGGCVCVDTCIYVCICVHVCLWVIVFVCMNACAYTCTYSGSYDDNRPGMVIVLNNLCLSSLNDQSLFRELGHDPGRWLKSQPDDLMLTLETCVKSWIQGCVFVMPALLWQDGGGKRTREILSCLGKTSTGP